MGYEQYMGLTGGLRKKPSYLGDYIKSYAQQTLYPMAEAKREKEQFDKQQAWEKEKADTTEAREREYMGLTDTYNKQVLAQQEQQRLSNEAFQNKSLEQSANLAQQQRDFAEKQNRTSNIISGANLGVSAVSALNDLGYDVVGGVGDLFKKGFDAISSWWG